VVTDSVDGLTVTPHVIDDSTLRLGVAGELYLATELGTPNQRTAAHRRVR
jgi:hypothetical protein